MSRRGNKRAVELEGEEAVVRRDGQAAGIRGCHLIQIEEPARVSAEIHKRGIGYLSSVLDTFEQLFVSPKGAR